METLEELKNKYKKLQEEKNNLYNKITALENQDKVDVELPDIDALIKENTSDEFIERKINDILGIKEK